MLGFKNLVAAHHNSCAELPKIFQYSYLRRRVILGPDSGAKVLALKTALKLALEMALDFLHWKKSENG